MVNLRHGLDYYAGCFEEAPSPLRWWLLHVSKACAMIVAGVLMGKDVMDTVNYWMVSALLEAHRDYEVALSAVLRICLVATLVGSNILIFLRLTNPASVWINMTALGFIGGLSQEVLSVAKRGVFGHNISQTLNSLNFHLTFHLEYPPWFVWVRGAVLVLSSSVVILFAAIVYI